MSKELLNQNELEALRILWAEGALKPAEIQSRFAWPIENATLRSVLVNLVEKGYICREQKGKAFHYQARVAKATLLQTMIGTLASVFSGGSNRELVAQLVETGDIKASDLKLICETAGEKRPRQPKGKSK